MAWSRSGLIGTLWFLVAFTLIPVCNRIYVRLTTVNRPWRELLVIFAWLCFLIKAIAHTAAWYHVNMHNMLAHEAPPMPEEITYYYKMEFIVMFCFTNGLNACKAVLLLTCLDICNRYVFPKIWWSIMVTFAILFIMEFGVATIWFFLQCFPGPLDAYWSSTAVCYNTNYNLTLWTTNAGTDIMLTIIPLVLVSHLKSLGRAKKIGVAAMFAVGFVNVLAVVTGMVAFLIPRYWKKSDAAKTLKTWNGKGLDVFMNVLVLPTAIIVVCVPQLRHFGNWNADRKAAASPSEPPSWTFKGPSNDESTIACSDRTKTGNIINGIKPADEENPFIITQKLVPEPTVLPRNDIS